LIKSNEMFRKSRLDWYSSTILLISYIPFLILPFFAYPAWDDYMLFPYVKANGVFETVKLFYFQFNGRFSSMTILSTFYLIAAKYGINGWIYQLTLFFNLLFFAFSVVFLFSKIFIDLSKPIVIALSFAFILLFNSISVNISQFYYWIASSLFYLLGISFMCIFFGIFFFYAPKLKTKLLLFLLAVFICGSIETNVILFNFIFFGAFAIRLSNGKKIERWVYYLGVWILLLSLAELLAPGGRNRSGQYLAVHAQDLCFTLKATSSFTWRLLISILVHPSLWIFSFYYFLLTRKSPTFFSTLIFRKPLTVLFTILLFLPFLFTLFLIFFGLGGNVVEQRVMTALTFLVLIAFIGQLELVRPLIADFFVKLENRKRIFMVIPILLIFSAFIRPSAFSVAISDLILGKASQYKMDQLHRLYILKNGPDEMGLPGLTVKPASLFTLDISKNPDSFFNPSFAKTYGKKKVWIVNDIKAEEFKPYPFKLDSIGLFISQDMN
jgi:hypothetical protein